MYLFDTTLSEGTSSQAVGKCAKNRQHANANVFITHEQEDETLAMMEIEG
jgi:hypothetical protein